MSDPSVTSFRLMFPEFTSTDDYSSPRIQFALDEAKVTMGMVQDKKKQLAQLYLAAHILSQADSALDTQGQALRSITMGRISESFVDASGGTTTNSVTTDLQATMYGKRYLRLLASQNPFTTIIHSRC